jgi:hypothetical protein
MSVWGKVWDVVTDVAHAVTGIPTADDRRNQQKMMNDQVKAYKEQTAIAREEIDRKRGEQMAEKRRVQEKQIRSLRHNFSPAGFLNTGADISNQLGA